MAPILQIVFREDILDEFLISVETFVNKIKRTSKDGTVRLKLGFVINDSDINDLINNIYLFVDIFNANYQLFTDVNEIK